MGGAVSQKIENGYRLTKYGFNFTCFVAGPLFYFFTGFTASEAVILGVSVLLFGAIVDTYTPSVSLDRKVAEEYNVEKLLDTAVSVKKLSDVNKQENSEGDEEHIINSDIVSVSVEGFDDGTIKLIADDAIWTFEGNINNTMSEGARDLYRQYSEEFLEGRITVLVQKDVDLDDIDDPWIISDCGESALLAIDDADKILHDKLNSKEHALN